MLNQKNAVKFIIALFLVGSSALTFAATHDVEAPVVPGVVGAVEVEAPEAHEVAEAPEAPEAPEVHDSH